MLLHVQLLGRQRWGSVHDLAKCLSYMVHYGGPRTTILNTALV